MKRKLVLTLVYVLGLLRLSAQLNPDVVNYIQAYKSLAMQEMTRSGVPAAITLAQGIHESESGKSNLVSRSNNHFGIKCRSDWDGDRVYHDDDARGECFRSYPTADDSYRDHSNFLRRSPRYGFLFELDPEDYKGWATGLKRAGYATNIRYPQILIKLIEQYNLQQYSLIALGKLSPAQEQVLAVHETLGAEGISAGPAAPKGIDPTPVAEAEMLATAYPEGVFRINDTRVVYAQAGTSLLAVAEAHQLSLAHLLDFNDLNSGDILKKGQLLYLQRKRKKGAVSYHLTLPGESLYTISQKEGVRYESLLSFNHLREGQEPAAWQKIYLQEMAPFPQAAADLDAPPALKNETSSQAVAVIANPAVGKRIRHRVQVKETLYSIAREYRTTVDQLMRWNNLSGTQLKVGQKLTIFK